jgi:hypothetical protein
MGYKYKLKEAKPRFAPGDISLSDGVKTTVTKVHPQTGAVSWDVEYTPNFEKIYNDTNELVTTLKKVYTQVKDDKVIRDLYDEAKKLRNKARTHIRNEYPNEYRTFGPGSMKEATQDVKVELPNITKTKANNQITTVSGFADFLLDVWDEVTEKEQDGIQNNTFMKQARAFLEKAQGETEPVAVDETSMSGAAGAYLTPYAFRIPKKKKKNKKIGEVYGDGADLGPGPKASEDGVNDNAYVKQFKYQIVKKNKDGTYVQKGSTLPVRKLW